MLRAPKEAETPGLGLQREGALTDRLRKPTSDVMTIPEVAAELRCSRAHVYNVINGRVAGVSPLPAISMGRRKLVRRASLEVWKRENEKAGGGGILPPSLEVGS